MTPLEACHFPSRAIETHARINVERVSIPISLVQSHRARSRTVNRANTTDQTHGVAVSHHETQEMLVPVTGKVMSPPVQPTRRWHRRRHIRLYQCYYGYAIMECDRGNYQCQTDAEDESTRSEPALASVNNNPSQFISSIIIPKPCLLVRPEAKTKWSMRSRGSTP